MDQQKEAFFLISPVQSFGADIFSMHVLIAGVIDFIIFLSLEWLYGKSMVSSAKRYLSECFYEEVVIELVGQNAMADDTSSTVLDVIPELYTVEFEIDQLNKIICGREGFLILKGLNENLCGFQCQSLWSFYGEN